MENADVSKMIKNRRAGTFGATPQASAPTKKPIPMPPQRRAPAPQSVAPTQENTAVPESNAPVQKTEIVKGFSAGITKDGKLVLELLGETPNYLELIALFEYTNVRKQEIVEQLANLGSVATRSNVVALTNNVNNLAKGLHDLVEELEHISNKVDTIYSTFIPEQEPSCTEG